MKRILFPILGFPWDHYKEYKEWKNRNFVAPYPNYIKRSSLVLNSFPDATWVETGTYLGDTTQILAGIANQVFTIEPAKQLFENATIKLLSFPNIEVIHGTSEEIFPTLLPKIKGPVNFWLDGHYSGGPTFQGAVDSPLFEELACIVNNLDRFSHVHVLIDDIRYCGQGDAHQTLENANGYPSLNFLVNWANQYGFRWHIENDIFIAKR